MARVLVPTAQRMFATLPPYYEGEPFLEGILNAVGNELARIRAKMDAIRLALIPQNATDEFRMLGALEMLFGLPVEPVGVPLAQRQALLRGYLSARDLSTGASWVEAMTRGMGSTVWTYQEGPGANQVTIYLAWGATSFSSVQVLLLARAITPAHIEIAAVYNTGFLVGEGLVGEDRL